MIDLTYSLVIEAPRDQEFFTVYSTDLEGFTGVGHSIEDCLYKARTGMQDHVQTMSELGLESPPPNANATVLIQNAQSTAVA